MKRIIVYGFLLVFGVFALGASPIIDVDFLEKRERKESGNLTMIFAGDIMLSRSIGKIIQGKGPLFPFELIATTTRDADITFGNLENPVSLRGKDQGSVYSFRANPDTLEGLVFAGFDAVSLANNHILDWGDEALLDSRIHLDEYGIASAGVGQTLQDARKPIRILKKGIEVCIFSYSQFAGWYGGIEAEPAIAPLTFEIIEEDLKNGDASGCAILVATIHWGNEYETKALDEQRVFARKIIDAGADLVIGHHPHVLQEVETYNGGLIAYSLGNFIFDQNFSPDTRKGGLLKVEFARGKLLDYALIPIEFTPFFQPYTI